MLGRQITISLLVLFMVIGGMNAWKSRSSGKSKNICYKCVADAKRGPCGDPFQLHGRKHFQEECESDWCIKLEIGPIGSPETNFVSTGHIER